MLARIGWILLMLASCSLAWGQTDAGSNADNTNSSNADAQLQVPPPVSGQAYSSTFIGDTESNYLRGGISVGSAYWSNVYGSATPVSDVSYSIWPTIELDKFTDQMHLSLNYSPGFTLYQRTTSLNQANQNLGINFQYRLSPNLTASVSEGLQKSSGVFDQPNPLAATPVSGSMPFSSAAIIAPLGSMFSNTTSAQLTYQVSAEGMIGGGGNYGTFSYGNSPQASGLFNSRSAGGSLFYSTRFRDKYYFGASYQYENFLSYQAAAPSTQTQTQTVFFFFTTYLKPNLSLSVSAGPQHYTSTQSPLPTTGAWQPMTMVSLSWRGEQTTISGSYSRTVSGAGGLNGTFNSNTASLAATWQLSRNWTTAVSGSYANYQSLTPLFFLSSPGGNTISGTASLSRSLGNHANLQCGYSWIHQAYSGVGALSSIPNISQVFTTLTFTFSRPLQR